MWVGVCVYVCVCVMLNKKNFSVSILFWVLTFSSYMNVTENSFVIQSGVLQMAHQPSDLSAHHQETFISLCFWRSCFASLRLLCCLEQAGGNVLCLTFSVWEWR